jgi:ribosome-binding factor A
MAKNKKKSIKVQRKESILREVIGEAFASLENRQINRLMVTDVVCSRDGSDAKVYLEKGSLTSAEQNSALKELRNARRYIQHLCRDITGWYRVPNLSFSFDNLLERENKMEELFRQIEESREKRGVKGEESVSQSTSQPSSSSNCGEGETLSSDATDLPQREEKKIDKNGESPLPPSSDGGVQ